MILEKDNRIDGQFLRIKYIEPKSQVGRKENKMPLLSNGGEAKCRTLALLENMGLRQSTVSKPPMYNTTVSSLF